MNKKTSHLIIDTLLLVVLIIFDRISKNLATIKLKGNEPFVLIKNVFELRYLENRGAAFSIFENKQTFFLVVTCIFIIVMIYAIIKLPVEKKYNIFEIVLVFLVSGAIGNMIDRIIQGYVVDYFYFSLIDFPIFNVADIYVSVGCVVFAIILLFVFKEEDLNFLSFKTTKKDE